MQNVPVILSGPAWRSFALALLLLFACRNGESQTLHESKLVIVLIDQTDSFGSDAERGVARTLYWDEALKKVKTIVNALRAKDEFIVLAINDRGFVDENILIKLQQFNRSALKARIETRTLGEEVLKLKREERCYSRTDITGSLRHAAHIAAREKLPKTVVICFSDMIQEPALPKLSEAADLHFPAKTKGYFYFVDASGFERWSQVLQAWVPLLQHAGMDIGDSETPNFFQYGETDRALVRMLKEW